MGHEAEGHGFNRAVKHQAEDLYRSAEGWSGGAAGTIELLSLIAAK
ncbi:hypothetical protein [Granulicella mallensis]|jgi:hypothetical protein|uniref:Uncharacterized protein n=1 Tax=Granulicella mallensis TaxID=940614 RepID=A0A7W8EBG6_9BACT|nr:hypothetical protein [Granulicella mallensis]MBB5065807.1 hypothetical protein [Granulicella mallensis]